jgi:hypothetical protein
VLLLIQSTHAIDSWGFVIGALVLGIAGSIWIERAFFRRRLAETLSSPEKLQSVASTSPVAWERVTQIGGGITGVLLLGVIGSSLSYFNGVKGGTRISPASQATVNQSFTSSTTTNTSSFTLPTQTTQHNSTDEQISALYKRSEQGFKDHNIEEYACYMSDHWTFKNTDEKTENRATSLNYISHNFQDATSKKEHTTDIHREIINSIPIDGDGRKINVWVNVKKSSGKTLRFQQTDYWENEGGNIRCYSEIKGIWAKITTVNENNTSDDAMQGERFPQTRKNLMSDEEIRSLNYADTRYAINEIYARHGFYFSDKKQAIRERFKSMTWYRPDVSLTSDQAEARFSSIEKENNTRLGLHREALSVRGLGD